MLILKYSYSSSNYSREKFISLAMVCYSYGQKSWEETQRCYFKKLALFYQGIQTLQKITNNGFTFPKTFVQDCRFYFSKELNISLIEVKLGRSSKNEFYG